MYTLDQYNALCAAIAMGVTIVKYGDKEMTYRSLSDMLRLKQTMEAQLGINSVNRRLKVEYSRGFEFDGIEGKECQPFR
jgi:hypothetical protein